MRKKFIIFFIFISFFLYLFLRHSAQKKNSSGTVFTVKPGTPVPITVIYLNFKKVTFRRNVNKYRQAYKQCRSSADWVSWSTLFYHAILPNTLSTVMVVRKDLNSRKFQLSKIKHTKLFLFNALVYLFK